MAFKKQNNSHKNLENKKSVRSITDVVCDRMELDSNNDVYQIVSTYQQMEKSKKTENKFKDNAVVDLKIAEQLENEDMVIIKNIYRIFLEPIANFIKENKTDLANLRYNDMMAILKGFYGINNVNAKQEEPVAKVKGLA